MAETDRPLLNPVLALHVEPKREAAPTGGKSRKDIVTGRLADQRRVLSRDLTSIYERRARLRTFGGRVQLVARMFDDSLAATKTPSSLFAAGTGARLVAPMRRGYLIEAQVDALPSLSRFVQMDTTVAAQVDISRVEHVHAFGPDDVLRGRNIDALWGDAPDYENGKGFLLAFAPFRDGGARENLMQRLAQYAQDQVLLPTSPTVSIPRSAEGEDAVALPVSAASQSSLVIGLRQYRNSGRARIIVQIASREALSEIVASGTVFRIDPVPQIEVTSPGEGAHPGPLPPDLSGQPIVGVVDGGRTAPTYDGAEVWRVAPLVRDRDADHKHGNRVTALAVHGHAWNTNLPLPELFCRVGTVQAVPRPNSGHRHNPQQLISYLDRVMNLHRNTRVWNMSFNEILPCDSDQVSFLGHEIARLARAYDVLPVISAGNKIASNQERIAPPADCEASLVVGGRKFDGEGAPGDPCDVALPGPGPEGMLKPDLSWYSTLRVLGGDVLTATSYVTPLVSSLAAHTFDNLKDPTPDLVRALLVNHTDLEHFEPVRGWGSPNSVHLPWHCQPGTVTLAWRSQLRPGLAYYWDNIPIPPSLVKGGKLCGRGLLTAVLNPHPFISPESDANYFSARVNVALQYRGRPANGKTPPVKNLLGTLKTDEIRETDARAEYFKWHPVRRHCRDFSSRGGLTFSGSTMRLFARVYMRDLYQFGLGRNDEVEPMEVAFVLSLHDGSDTSNLYNEMRATLGAYVESAVLDQEIDVET